MKKKNVETANMTKRTYNPPTLGVTQVMTESTIADSGTYKVTLEDWQQDQTGDAAYDGDIWLNI